ncbi:unnamed protein product [Zymoseptoria tritici ST99CH_1A5]|uniref:F-box domain-containing protein n=1 Tax=Zymoseptoria tritici ST99CH_1A5 TaxID=1276529 RepID=A0A1Y6L7F9_ZYMTR|nr:unnamed protein product [Zymoseptoria tritici ST99CH_1A5]
MIHSKQDRVLAGKPSTSFSTVSSGASATSAASVRSGGSRLLFGEIDTTSDRSIDSYASVCNLVLCDSSTLLKFWLEDRCRETLLSCLPKRDLASLRLACHDFGVRAAPALFADLSITFSTNIFTRPSKLAALDRLGFYVKTLRFNLPHSADTFLPPLIEPDTGAELSFTYTPNLQEASTRRPKYGDLGTTEILTRQYPPIFHAATNVSAFVRAFSAFVNLEHLAVSCLGFDASQRFRRSAVDYALISLRIAVEKDCLNALNTLTLSPIHPGGLIYLAPLLGFGASPRSASRWSRIRNLVIHANSVPANHSDSEPDQLKLLQTYLRNFQHNLETFDFRWIGQRGRLPLRRPSLSERHGEHPAHARRARIARPGTQTPSLVFPKMKCVKIENVSATSHDISTFIAMHKTTIEELDLEDIDLTHGTWDDALSPLTKRPPRQARSESADIPIMLSPTAGPSLFPSPMERLSVVENEPGGRKSLRMSTWLRSKAKRPSTAQKMREGLIGCEEQLRKVLRGSVFAWK